MRTVFVFPETDLASVRQRITDLARQGQDDRWVVDVGGAPEDAPALYVSIDATADDVAPLFSDWEPSAVEHLTASLGHRPDWAVVCDVSGRIPGDEEIRAFVLELLAEGGVAMDDYSDHCWTAAEIAEDRAADGLRFFDYRTSFERSREPGP
ncbi:MAG: hypothetical protein M3134_01240 [Actinomycetota bacterium]|nr:hypothetical protein [Actinomycetota bacterium]